MKKSTIVMLCVGGALLILGGMIFFLTFSMGAVGYEGNIFQFGFGRHDADELYIYDNNSYDNKETYTYGGRVYENKALDLEGANAQFTQVELQLGMADATITQDGGPGFVNAENFPEGKLPFEVTDGKLVVKDLSQNMNFNFGIKQSKRQRKLTVNLPPDVELSAITISRGVGDLDVKGVSAGRLAVTDGVGDLAMVNVRTNDLSLSGGVGDCTLTDLICVGDVDITRGMGDVELIRTDITGNLTVSGGTGDFDLEGSVKGDISIDVGVGDCDLELIGNRDDYYFTLNKGVGDIDINDVDISSKQKTYGKVGAPYTIDIQGGVGEVDVEFVR